MFTAETKILYRTRARAGSGDGIAEVKVGQIFNFDSVTMELSDKVYISYLLEVYH